MIPALFDFGHAAYIAGAVDDFGDPTDTWAAPVTKRFVTWAARFDTDEPKLAGHNRDVVDTGIIIYPDVGPISPRDRITIDGQVFEVVGQPERADKAWWDCDITNWTINLRQVNG